MASAYANPGWVRDLGPFAADAAAFWAEFACLGKATPDCLSALYYPAMLTWLDQNRHESSPLGAETLGNLVALQHAMHHYLVEHVGPEDHVTAEGPLGQLMHAVRPAVRGELAQVPPMVHSEELLQYCRAGCAVGVPWTLAVLALLRNATPADVSEARSRLGRWIDSPVKTLLETQLRELAPGTHGKTV